MVDIFDEVDEELRAERAQQLLKRYSGVIVAGVLLIVGAAVGWQGWRWYAARQDGAAAAQYLVAMNLANATAAGSSEASRTAAIATFSKLATALPEGYATLARLREAALKADAGDAQGAAGTCGIRWRAIRRPTRCCATSRACSGRSIRSTPVIRRCWRRG